MKKTISLILILALMMCLSVPIFASEQNNRTDFTYNHFREPSFTVVIPAVLQLRAGDNYLQILSSDIKYLGDDQIVVYLADSGNQVSGLQDPSAVFQLLGVETGVSVFYQLRNRYGWVQHFPPQVNAIGTILTWLDDSASHDDIRLHIPPRTVADHPNDTYQGYITFGIALLSVYEQR
jgi:hypothetical protein